MTLFATKITKSSQMLTLKKLNKTTLMEFSRQAQPWPPVGQTPTKMTMTRKKSNQFWRTCLTTTTWSWRLSRRLRRWCRKSTPTLTRLAWARLRLWSLTSWRLIPNYLSTHRWWRTSSPGRLKVLRPSKNSTLISSTAKTSMMRLTLMVSTR